MQSCFGNPSRRNQAGSAHEDRLGRPGPVAGRLGGFSGLAMLGTPEIAPVPLSPRPGGRAPAVSVYVMGGLVVVADTEAA